MNANLSIKPCILAINGGSSSIKFAMFEAGGSLTQIFKGSIDQIECKSAVFQVKGLDPKDEFVRKVPDLDQKATVDLLINWIESHSSYNKLIAIGHRIVHGGPKYSQPQKINREFIKDLHSLSQFAPDHLPEEIVLVETFYNKFSHLSQFACFDTAFHHDLPRIAKLLPIPLEYEDKGIRRYGFHGLSYEFLMEELFRLGGAEITQGRVILAHLGSGASLAAVHHGKSIDTSMSFTPTAGLPMSTRSGDIDPGLFGYLALEEGLNAEKWSEMINFKSGLLGLSETSSDIRDLLLSERSDKRALEAVSLFCYQVKKWIGSFAAALGGVDTLVFSGGIGENLSVIRARICQGLEFLGINLEEKKNSVNEGIISTEDSKVMVRVIPTDEERMIAKIIYQNFNLGAKRVK